MTARHVAALVGSGLYLFAGLASAQAPFPRHAILVGTQYTSYRLLDVATFAEVASQSPLSGQFQTWRLSFYGTVDERGYLYDFYANGSPTPPQYELSRFGIDETQVPWQWLSLQTPWRVPLGAATSLPTLSTRKHVIVAEGPGFLRKFLKDVPGQSPALEGQLLSGLTYEYWPSVCDGRELFAIAYPYPSAPPYQFDIYAFDLENPNSPWRHVGNFGPLLPRGLAQGRDNRLYVAVTSGAVHEIDKTTGAILTTHPFTWPSQSFGFRYDPWSDTGVAAELPTNRGLDQAQIDRVQVHTPGSNWAIAYIAPFRGDWGGAFAFTDGQPFEFYGSGCRNGLGKEPRLSWQGLPRQNETFTIHLRDGEPNGFAMMWIGWNDLFWSGVGTLPFDAAPFGAPGCRLLVSPDGPLPFFLDGNGGASYTIQVPNNPAIADMQAFAQSVSSSTANPLGFASSDALIIRLR